jgi:hypothetical protein
VHRLTAVIADRALVERARAHFSVEPALLPHGLALLRLSRRRAVPEGPRSGPPGFYGLAFVADALIELSAHGPIAYVETDYFAACGDQAAAVYRDGALVYAAGIVDLDDPRHGGIGNINGALRLLGVTAGASFDELDAIELDRHR